MSTVELVERITNTDRDEVIEAARFFSRKLTKHDEEVANMEELVVGLVEDPFAHVADLESLARAILIGAAQDEVLAADVITALDGSARKQFVLGGNEIVALAAPGVVALKILVTSTCGEKTNTTRVKMGKDSAVTVEFEESDKSITIDQDLGAIVHQVFVDAAPTKGGERQISAWFSERETRFESLAIGESYTLNFKVGVPVAGNLVIGQAGVDDADIPDQGLKTSWVVRSATARLASISPEVEVVHDHSELRTGWTARFPLLIPKTNDSARIQLRVELTELPASLDVAIFAQGELYRELEVNLEKNANIASDVVHASAGHLHPPPSNEWMTPEGRLTIRVHGTSAIVFGEAGGKTVDYEADWRGSPELMAGKLQNLRAAAESFWVAHKDYLNDIDPLDLDQKLNGLRSNGDFPYWPALQVQADAAHQQSWDTVANSDELFALAQHGYVSYNALFPRDTRLRQILDGLGLGHRINISWQAAGTANWIPHVPWGLFYIKAPAKPVDPMGFIALRYRIAYTKHLSCAKRNFNENTA